MKVNSINVWIYVYHKKWRVSNNKCHLVAINTHIGKYQNSTILTKRVDKLATNANFFFFFVTAKTSENQVTFFQYNKNKINIS